MLVIVFHLVISIDLGRIEFLSKRGNYMLSTCLSLPEFSDISKTKATNLCLIF